MQKRGGKRKGAGRPKGSNVFGEPTKPIRVPVSLAQDIIQLIQHKKILLPLFDAKVPAGYPLPCDDSIDQELDLNDFLIKHPAATFLARAKGHSMINAGIYDNDILIVDRSIEPKHDKIVVAAVDGHLTVKRLYRKNGKCLLVPENEEFQPIDISQHADTVIWGVVIHVIHSV